MKTKIIFSILLIFLFLFSLPFAISIEPEGGQTPEEFSKNFDIGFSNDFWTWFFSAQAPFGLNLKTYSTDLFVYLVMPWQAPIGGTHCEEINDFEFPFSDYQCKSLGADCIIINRGEEDQKCIHDNPDDSIPPLITPAEKVRKENYLYIKTGSEWPSEYGYKIVFEPNNEGCIPPFTEVVIGINTSEYAQCKISPKRKPEDETIKIDDYFNELGELMEGSLFLKEHTVTLPAAGFPSEEAISGSEFELTFDEEYEFFIRCQDQNGNFNKAAFSAEFCIQDGPDTTPPSIIRTNAPLDGTVSFNVTTYPLEVITNEPADCRWDFTDLNYEDMQYNMSNCSHTVDDMINPNEYGCKTTLTGIKVGEEKDYFIKCKDKPWLSNLTWLEENGYDHDNKPEARRIINTDPKIISLMSTNQLMINSITVNEKENGSKLVDSVDPLAVYLEVETISGANEGYSKCEYSVNGSYVDDFYDDGNPDFKPAHIQRLDLVEGEYTYGIKCRDEANNVATGEISFTIELDTTAPIVTRVYEENGNLKIKTNEDANCKYSLDNCNFIFNEGIDMITSDGFNHYTEWNTEFDLFIKCEDLFFNRPDGCSIEVRAYKEETI